MATDPLFLGIDHVGIAVADLDEALVLHTEILGWRLVHRERNVEQGVEEAMLSSDGQTGPSAQLQLLAPLSPDSPIASFLSRRGPGIQQLAYRVRDVDAVASVLRARGLRVLYPEAKRGTGGSRINFIHPADLGGVLLEIVEPPAQ